MHWALAGTIGPVGGFGAGAYGCIRVAHASHAASFDTEANLTFWNWRRSPGPTGTQGSAALAAAAPDLAPIELYTADARIVGWLAPNGQRVTDLLATQRRAAALAPEPRPARRNGGAQRGAPGSDDAGEWESLPTAR